jgi:hypothetical protein
MLYVASQGCILGNISPRLCCYWWRFAFAAISRQKVWNHRCSSLPCFFAGRDEQGLLVCADRQQAKERAPDRDPLTTGRWCWSRRPCCGGDGVCRDICCGRGRKRELWEIAVDSLDNCPCYLCFFGVRVPQSARHWQDWVRGFACGRGMFGWLAVDALTFLR